MNMSFPSVLGKMGISSEYECLTITRSQRTGYCLGLSGSVYLMAQYTGSCINLPCNYHTVTETIRGGTLEICLQGAVIPDVHTANIVLQSLCNTPRSVFRRRSSIADQDLSRRVNGCEYHKEGHIN